MPTKKPASEPSGQAVAVKTGVTTQTKVLVAAAGVLAVGLAAYGFGFAPFLEDRADDAAYEADSGAGGERAGARRGFLADGETGEVDEIARCQASCEEVYDKCKMYRDVEECNKEYDICRQECVTPTPPPDDRSFGGSPDDPSPDKSSEPSSGSEDPLSGGSVTSTGGATSTEDIVRGNLFVEPGYMPEGVVLAANSPEWRVAATYHVRAGDNGALIDMISLSLGARYTPVDVAVAQFGFIYGTASTGPSSDWVNVNFSTPFRVPREGAYFQILVKTGPLPASLSDRVIDGRIEGASSLTVGINRNLTIGEWDRHFEGMLNIRAVDPVTGVRLFATGGSLVGSHRMIIRRSFPMVTPLELTSYTIAPGSDMDLYRFRISAATSSGDVAIKRLTFAIEMENSDRTRPLTLSNFRFRTGSRDVFFPVLRIVDEAGTDLFRGSLSVTSTGVATTSRYYVSVIFEDEEIVTGGGNVYSLHATVLGSTAAGNRITARLLSSGNVTMDATGYISNYDEWSGWSAIGESISGPHLDRNAPPDGRADVFAPFLWSDLSSPSHSAREGSRGGSADWIPVLDDPSARSFVSRRLTR